MGKKTNAVKPLSRTVVNLSLNTPQSESHILRSDSQVGGVSPVESNTFTSGPASLPGCSKNTNSASVASNPSDVNVFQLEQHCKDLEDELDQVKFQIVKIVSDKNDYSKENAVLKTYQNAFAALTEQNELLKRKVKELSSMDSLIATNRSDQDIVSQDMTNDITTGRQVPEIDRYSPDGQEKEPDQVANCKSDFNLEDQVLKLNDQLFESEKVRSLNEERFQMEKKDSIERNKYVLS